MANQNNPTPNDQRSNVKNPNNPAFHYNNGNRGGQMNPQHPNYQGGQPAKGGDKSPGGNKK